MHIPVCACKCSTIGVLCAVVVGAYFGQVAAFCNSALVQVSD